MNKKPSKEEILEAIRQSGYLLEQEIATFLEDSEFHVETNKSYEDLDTKKSREIDVFAIKRIYNNEENKINIFVNLLCECKNNSNPFVFIGRRKNQKDNNHIPEQFSFPIRKYRRIIEQSGNTKKFQEIPAFKHLNLNNKFLFYNSKLKYVQFSKIIEEKGKFCANHEGIFNSILMPMIKSLLYYQKKHTTEYGGWKTVWLHFPVVIINSDLIKLNTTNQIYSLETEPYLSVIREIDADNIKGTFLIDFTNKDNFHNYLNYVNNFVEEIKNIIEKQLDFFLKEEFTEE